MGEMNFTDFGDDFEDTKNSAKDLSYEVWQGNFRVTV